MKNQTKKKPCKKKTRRDAESSLTNRIFAMENHFWLRRRSSPPPSERWRFRYEWSWITPKITNKESDRDNSWCCFRCLRSRFEKNILQNQIKTWNKWSCLSPDNFQVLLVTWPVWFERSRCQRIISIPPSAARSRIPARISPQPEFVEIAPAQKEPFETYGKQI